METYLLSRSGIATSWSPMVRAAGIEGTLCPEEIYDIGGIIINDEVFNPRINLLTAAAQVGGADKDKSPFDTHVLEALADATPEELAALRIRIAAKVPRVAAILLERK
jgi:hypothetical protein